MKTTGQIVVRVKPEIEIPLREKAVAENTTPSRIVTRALAKLLNVKVGK